MKRIKGFNKFTPINEDIVNDIEGIKAAKDWFLKHAMEHGIISHATTKKRLESIKELGLTNSRNYFSLGNYTMEEFGEGPIDLQITVQVKDVIDRLYPDPEYNLLYKKLKGYFIKGKSMYDSLVTNNINPDVLFLLAKEMLDKEGYIGDEVFVVGNISPDLLTFKDTLDF